VVAVKSMEKEFEGKEILLKILLVGEPAVGKTSLLQRYVKGVFTSQYRSTIGTDFAMKIIRLADDLQVRIQFWDLAGQERFGSQIKAYFREADGALCVCDAIRPATREKALDWKKLIQQNSTNQQGQHIEPECFLIINKIDLLEAAYKKQAATDESFYEDDASTNNVDPEQMKATCERMAKQTGFFDGAVVSAKDGSGVNDVILKFVKHLVHLKLNAQQFDDVHDNDLIKLGYDPEAVLTPAKRWWNPC